MTFATGSFQQIKSISQRSLALHWDRLRDGQTLPSLDAFHPPSRMHEPKQLAVWAVEHVFGEHRKFRALHQGGFVAEALGTGWEGKTLDEVTPKILLPAFEGASNECADTACAIYTILTTCNESSHAVDLERLLLPFGRQNTVEFIVASLQLVSLDSQPERRTIARDFERHAVETLKIRILPSVKGEIPRLAPA